MAAGPGIRAADPSVSPAKLSPDDLPLVGHVIDLAPTILALLELPLGRDMDGAVLNSVVDPAFLDARPLSYVDTHDTAEWVASRGSPVPEVPGTPERIEQLRSLGYIDDDATEKENP